MYIVGRSKNHTRFISDFEADEAFRVTGSNVSLNLAVGIVRVHALRSLCPSKQSRGGFFTIRFGSFRFNFARNQRSLGPRLRRFARFT